MGRVGCMVFQAPILANYGQSLKNLLEGIGKAIVLA
jgi:hypothetical protein